MIRKLLFLMVLPFGALVAQQPSVTAPGQQGVIIKAEKPEYSSQAKITSQVAVDSALARVPGGQIHEGELEKEHGRLVYSFDVAVPQRKGVQEVQVDARSGKVVSVKHESAAAEAKEHAAEHAKHHGQPNSQN
jgi:Peptidase propeptide and YPEB domain